MCTPAVSCPLALLAAATVAGAELTEGDQLQVQLILQLSCLFTEFWVGREVEEVGAKQNKTKTMTIMKTKIPSPK